MNGLIRVDQQGFIWAGEDRLPLKFDLENNCLIFHDKDRRRSSKRGTDQIVVPLPLFAVQLVDLHHEAEPSSGGDETAD